MLDISKDIHSLSDFKRNTSELVQDAISYQKLLDRMDQLEALEGIKRGLADVDAGRVTPLKEFEQEFRKKRGIPSRSR